MGRYDAVLRVQVGCREPQRMPALLTANDQSFHSIRTSEHASRKIYATLRQQLPNLARAHSLATQTNFGDFARHEVEFLTNPFEQFNVSFTIVPKVKATTQIHFARL